MSRGAIDQSKAVSGLTELGHLASGVGHHVINAFSAVVSNAEILRMKLDLPDPPDPSALADAIIRTALEASAVARRLIDVTRPMTANQNERVQLDNLVADYVAARQESPPDPELPKIHWSSNVEAVPPINGNSAQLRLMLDHLTNNSIEAANGGSVDICISTSVDQRGWVALEIRDNGRAMTPIILERAVEPFYSTKLNHLGVGLSIANGIWRRHKGTLSILSLIHI